MAEKKLGRPTNNPKGKPIHIRLDSECEKIVNNYSSEKNVSKAEAIRQGIMKLKDDIKKQNVCPWKVKTFYAHHQALIL